MVGRVLLMLKFFTLRVRSGDNYFSLWEVLTLSVKNGEDLKASWQWTSTHGPVPSLLCSDKLSHDKMQGIL